MPPVSRLIDAIAAAASNAVARARSGSKIGSTVPSG